MLKYEFVNPQDIPDNLPINAQYTTRVIDIVTRGCDLIVRLQFVGEVYNSHNPQCLFPLTKQEVKFDRN